MTSLVLILIYETTGLDYYNNLHRATVTALNWYIRKFKSDIDTRIIKYQIFNNVYILFLI